MVKQLQWKAAQLVQAVGWRSLQTREVLLSQGMLVRLFVKPPDCPCKMRECTPRQASCEQAGDLVST